MQIAHYRDLGVYRIAADLRQQIFSHSKKWPPEERYALTQQARRSSRAISANLAEGWAKRRYTRHFISKLVDALGEAEETTVWLVVAHECGYVGDDDHSRMMTLARQVCGGLVRMMRHPGHWCGPSRLTGASG